MRGFEISISFRKPRIKALMHLRPGDLAGFVEYIKSIVIILTRDLFESFGERCFELLVSEIAVEQGIRKRPNTVALRSTRVTLGLLRISVTGSPEGEVALLDHIKAPDALEAELSVAYH
jgi:hypothetical protein